ncbi:MAG: bifunctional phosphopantothenoylcysteine decarboxylase/phosphopantothenate--cysteine ligase CoaBC [Rhodospirillaceae bacterium]|nr:bifunctional phosphopantothenoylcysteine decarboxylase/phosphopantothenate--cysteine ligase CoaBC [Rhodospirillaceae bacterium]
MLNGKTILLIVTGGIAAYKSLILVRRLRERGATVRTVLTAAGEKFVTPLSVSALSHETVYTDLFSLTDEAEMGHLRLSQEADLIVVAPATADILAKMANGLADDLASTVLLAADAPILVAPAMNHRMWQHPATVANMAVLEARGVLRVGPEDGPLAEDESGPGRMAEPEDILAAIEQALGAAAHRPLAGRRALVTSGPTFEAIDPVRFIGNRSSGKQGHAIATALSALGAETVLVTGPVALADPPELETVHVESARDMLAACEAALPADVAVCAAAVSDWRAERSADRKLKKEGKAPPDLSLTENPDILATLARSARRPALVVGFAAETENVVANAQAKRAKKGCDWIVANDVSAAAGTFGGDANRVHLIREDGVEDWPKLAKQEVADRLAGRIAQALESGMRESVRAEAAE